MVIVKPKYGGSAARFRIEDNIKRRLEKKGLRGLGLKEPLVTIVLKSINVVNDHLEQGQYFFTDIKRKECYFMIVVNLNYQKKKSYYQKQGKK